MWESMQNQKIEPDIKQLLLFYLAHYLHFFFLKDKQQSQNLLSNLSWSLIYFPVKKRIGFRPSALKKFKPSSQTVCE